MTPPMTNNRVVRGTWFPKGPIGGASVDADEVDVVVGANAVVEVGELVVVTEVSELDITVEVSELEVGRGEVLVDAMAIEELPVTPIIVNEDG